MTAASQWRLRLARELVAGYASQPGVEVVLVGGSVARGTADAYSDIEIGIFWKTAPTEEVRRAHIHRMNGKLFKSNPYRHDASDAVTDGGEESLFLGGDEGNGVKVDIHHKLVKSVDQILDDVLVRFDPSIEKQELASMLQSALSLFGSDRIDEWKVRTRHYPNGLAEAMVRAHLRFNPLFGPRMLIDRKDMFLERIAIVTAYQQRLLCVLMGLNRLFHRGDYKWLGELARQMQVCPKDLLSRLESVYQEDADKGWIELRELIDETCTLVETKMPTIDTTAARGWFKITRRAWEMPPPSLEF